MERFHEIILSPYVRTTHLLEDTLIEPFHELLLLGCTPIYQNILSLSLINWTVMLVKAFISSLLSVSRVIQ